MTKRMLIDAVHPEEIRVAITEDGRLDDFDSESALKKPIKGNIYLAKVTRVEPSLQAAFIEYGGNRQGFLPFSEIHYDYFQIPTEDKQKLEELLQKEKEEVEKLEEAELEGGENPAGEIQEADDFEKRSISNAFYRKYKIQEVIKRNQIILVQIIKEERGNKGASVTTYISLPGKYCVLMPKTDNQGGVSRKIMNIDVRRKLRKTVKEIETPKGMSVIIRTAGAERTKAEVKRDFSYLLKLWEKIRDNAIKSTAPSMVYEEGNIVKRSIRDMYDGTIDEVIIEGDKAFDEAQNFMNLISPADAAKVQKHTKKDPIFWEYNIEDELSTLFEIVVPLRSGGYVVFNPTEALVAIDVNSGKATRERNVESTALKTNLEAAKEIARQLRLRDLSGLIVIDFIDMLELRNKKTIERALKDALEKDRAKIQVGRISTFGLLEMSRQRLRSSVVETTTVKCPRCRGLGLVRSKDSSSVTLLREIEHDARQENKPDEIVVYTSQELADYMKKEKSAEIEKIEKETKVSVEIKSNDGLMGAQFAIGKEALDELLEALKEEEKQHEKEEVVVVPGSGGTPVHQDDVNASEIVILEEEGDNEPFMTESEKIEGNGADRENYRRDRDNRHGGPRNRRDKRGGRNKNFRGGDDRNGDRNNDREDRPRRHRDRNRGRDRDRNYESQNSDQILVDANVAEENHNREPIPGRDKKFERKPNTYNDNVPMDKSAFDSYDDKGKMAQNRIIDSTKKTETTEAQRSIIKNLWKKITD